MTGKSFALITSLIFSLAVFAEENCVNCPNRKVDGIFMPANFAKIASVVNKAELPTDFDSKVNSRCVQYQNMPPQDTLFMAKEIAESKYPFAEVIKYPNCRPMQIGAGHKITMLQLLVEQPIDRFQSLETMYMFCVKKLKKEHIFIDVVFALNTDEMKPLDSIVYADLSSPRTRTESLNNIKDFVCARGGV
ncbi:MAG: hypothetical protein Fur0010_23610 [Bdellovibrio sp.]